MTDPEDATDESGHQEASKFVGGAGGPEFSGDPADFRWPPPTRKGISGVAVLERSRPDPSSAF
jgi:hypothetical protein